MSISPFTTSPDGGVDFSVNFENAVFGMLPAALALVIMIIIASFKWSSRSFCRGRKSAQAWMDMVRPHCVYKTLDQGMLRLTHF